MPVQGFELSMPSVGEDVKRAGKGVLSNLARACEMRLSAMTAYHLHALTALAKSRPMDFLFRGC